ncbi:hypothetical protein GGTG_03520 [Gaeumannomyces tritici R3-111a-1]|uniref:Uncharacterized protein n=1 Tax=Gaeumannomyces tritici (strain R3-111a-1) TaxID=644352 RepID=J3NQG3_GAET3|nr:hypothetical protein GGTG_03520 [Gaeumannomyces tritici R3-111a-1]EJT78419.1 hypothetical protein GGTG_03520 [Gaeumannomyces tritici R3-111a-1]
MASMRSLLFCLCFALAAAQMATNSRQRGLGIQDLPVCGVNITALYGIGWGQLRKEQEKGGGGGGLPGWGPPQGQGGGGGRLGAAMARVSRPGSAILSRGSRAARTVGDSIGSVVYRARPARGARRGYRQVQWDSRGGGGGGVTYPADTYRHPAFEDAGEASDAAAGPPSRPESGSGGGGGGGNRQSSFEVRTQPRSHVNYHLPRRPARREPGGAVTDIGLPSPRRKSFRPSAGRRELVTI